MAVKKRIKSFLIKVCKPEVYIYIRDRKDKIVQKICGPILKINADIVTSTGFICGVLSINFLGSSHYLFLTFWGITRFLDIIDGTIYRYNYKTLTKRINLDKYADVAYDSLLTIAAIPYTGVFLAATSVIARFIHLRLEKENWADNILAPHAGVTHFFFIFRMFRTGVIFQALYSFVTPLLKRLTLPKDEVLI